MKSIIIFASFLFFNAQSFGQPSFTAAIQLTKNNVLYTQVDNPFSIQANVPLSDIECSINRNGLIINQTHNWFIIRVTEPGYYAISLTQKSTGMKTTYTFRAKNLPIPFANISNVSNDSITTNQLLEAEELSLSYLPAFDYSITAEVISFSVHRISKDNKRSELNNYGGTFSNEIKELFKNCSRDDILIFKKIFAKGLDPDTLKIPDLIIYLK